MAGRPTDFKEEYIELAYNYCLLGAKDTELAKFFDVSEQTINAWKNKHPEFLEALKEGKDQADANVSRSLYNKALGYDKDDKHYPADTTACIFWLKNRQPDKWRDKKEVGLTDDRNPEELTDAELVAIIKEEESRERASKKKGSKKELH